MLSMPKEYSRYREVSDEVAVLMETGQHGKARELLAEFAVEAPEQSETIRLSCVRKYGTGL